MPVIQTRLNKTGGFDPLKYAMELDIVYFLCYNWVVTVGFRPRFILFYFSFGGSMPTTTRDIPAPSGFVQPKRAKRNPYATLPATLCRICGDNIPHQRQRLGKTTCIDCQADLDRTEPTPHLIAIPYNKGAYQYIHNPRDLFQTNPKEPRE